MCANAPPKRPRSGQRRQRQRARALMMFIPILADQRVQVTTTELSQAGVKSGNTSAAARPKQPGQRGLAGHQQLAQIIQHPQRTFFSDWATVVVTVTQRYARHTGSLGRQHVIA